jgi:tetratricopeptide (TPR) repeat protein
LLVACSDNPAVRLRYKAEKLHFEAQKSLKTAQDLGNLSPEQVFELYPEFRACVDFCYEALDSIDAASYPVEYKEISYLGYEASMAVARLFLSVRAVDSTIAILDHLTRDISLSDRQLLPVYLNLGRALQASGRFDSASIIYRFTIEEFYPPIDNLGEILLPAFNLPRQLFRFASGLGDTTAATQEFIRAERYYTRLFQEYPDTKLAVLGHLALADLYNDARQWEKELVQLEAIAHSGNPAYGELLLRIADARGGGLQQYDTALAIYDYVLKSLAPGDTVLAPTILSKMCMVMMDQKKFENARLIIGRLKKEHHSFFVATPMPQYTLARALELEGRWERAEAEYSLLIEKYPGSDEAMMAILHVIDHLRERGRIDESQAWFQKAEGYFDDLAFRGIGTLLEAKALFYRAELHRRNSEYARSAEILVSVFEKFPGSEPGRRAVMAAAELYRKQLTNPDKADSLLNVLRQRWPGITREAENTDLFTD